MKGHVNLQDIFLNQLRKKKIPVTIKLVNGFELKGTIYGFDSFTIILDNHDQQMVYKHSISTLTPKTPITELFTDKEEKTSEHEIT